jgi:hypothetical protein
VKAKGEGRVHVQLGVLYPTPSPQDGVSSGKFNLVLRSPVKWTGLRVPEAHNSGMVEISRAHMLDVSVKADRPPRWEWQVTFNGEMIANGFADGRIEARFEGYNAMFLLLAAGWNP